MKKLFLNIDEQHYQLFLRFLQTLDYVKVVEEEPQSAINYDFSDLAGQLQWQGNALEAQKQLRDEW
jgi:hypothetical protein